MLKDNYAISADNAKALFLKEDQEQLIKKFRLNADRSYLYIRFLDMTYRIDRSSGNIQKSTDNQNFVDDSSHSAVLSIYDYLCWSREDRQLAGRWVSLQSLGHSFHTGLLEGENNIFAQSARLFAEHKEALEQVCVRLNGQKMPVGDVSYVLQLFDELPIYFQFWEGDEEFPSKLCFLWDANTQQYVHYETTYYILQMLLDRMTELL